MDTQKETLRILPGFDKEDPRFKKKKIGRGKKEIGEKVRQEIHETARGLGFSGRVQEKGLGKKQGSIMSREYWAILREERKSSKVGGSRRVKGNPGQVSHLGKVL